MKDPTRPPRPEPDLRPVEGQSADEELAAFAKAIAHPVRVQILRILERRTSCACGKIVEELSLAQSTVSQHLKVMKDGGLLSAEIEGARVCYRIAPAALRRFRSLVAALCRWLGPSVAPHCLGIGTSVPSRTVTLSLLTETRREG